MIVGSEVVVDVVVVDDVEGEVTRSVVVMIVDAIEDVVSVDRVVDCVVEVLETVVDSPQVGHSGIHAMGAGGTLEVPEHWLTHSKG